MADFTSLGAVLTIGVIIADCIFAGVVGLIRKEIYIENMVIRIFLYPLGLIGGIINYFIHRDADRGSAAIASSFASIAFGILLTVFFLPFYLDEFGWSGIDSLRWLVPTLLLLVIISLIFGIIYASSKKS